MNRAILFLLLIPGLLAGACKKEKTGITTLTGKWRLTAQYSSPGGGGVWKNVDNKNNEYFVQFRTDSTITGTGTFEGFDHYSLKDSITMTVTQAGANRHEFIYRIKDGLLTVSPSYPYICIEGCASRYEKLNN